MTNTEQAREKLRKHINKKTHTNAQYIIVNDKCTHEDETNGCQENDGSNHSNRFEHLHK